MYARTKRESETKELVTWAGHVTIVNMINYRCWGSWHTLNGTDLDSSLCYRSWSLRCLLHNRSLRAETLCSSCTCTGILHHTWQNSRTSESTGSRIHQLIEMHKREEEIAASETKLMKWTGRYELGGNLGQIRNAEKCGNWKWRLHMKYRDGTNNSTVII